MTRILPFLLLAFQLACTAPQSPWISGFVKPKQNPILTADSNYWFVDPVTADTVAWQRADVFNPAAVVRNDTVFMLFRAEDNPSAILGRRTSRIGLAFSTNGLDFTRLPEPVLYPDSSEWMAYDYPGGVEDPRVVATADGGYMMLYTSWNYDLARLSVATSPDLIHWKKHGPAFRQAHQGRFLDIWSKSGAVITGLQNGQWVATQINGKYWMYWGEDFVNLAWSENLIDWTPLLDDKGELLRVMQTRPYQFDSRLTEPGPPALLTDRGILLFYNGKNAEDSLADPNIPRGMYCGGQALFDAQDPARLLQVMDEPFIRPDLPHEVTGQYASGTTFIEGLVYFKEKWWLYYGTADSMVGVTVAPGESL